MKIKLLIFTLLIIPSIAFADDAAKEYALAKVRLMKTLQAAEIYKNPVIAEIEEFKRPEEKEALFKNNEGEYIGPNKAINAKCSAFFAFADSISEPTLFKKCSDWGWSPGGQSSF